ncbi:hypothetical protein [Saccharothrix yanglingensis]|nr:hypothetical protein [Saccharothrix yanglingensis]
MTKLRSTVLLALVVSLSVACGGEDLEPPRRNPALLAAVEDFMTSDLARKPFKEFTDWEWDRLFLFDMDDASYERIDALVGERVSPLRAFGGLFVYFRGDKVVRVELLEEGGYCEGQYTTAAYVRKGYSCWLADDAFTPFPP